MTIERMDHVSVVVDDLPAAIAFFTTLGMAREGEMPVEGPWVDRVNALERPLVANKQITLRLPSDIPAGNISIGLKLRGLTSNPLLIRISP